MVRTCSVHHILFGETYRKNHHVRSGRRWAASTASSWLVVTSECADRRIEHARVMVGEAVLFKGAPCTTFIK
jgi:hypothetical protein